MRHQFTSKEARSAGLKSNHSQAARTRAGKLSPERRSEIARLGGLAKKANWERKIAAGLRPSDLKCFYCRWEAGMEQKPQRYLTQEQSIARLDEIQSCKKHRHLRLRP